MISKSNKKAWLILGTAVAVFAISGGLMMASNMGFKINKGLTNGAQTNTNKGLNWVSVPFINPYLTFGGLCKAFSDQFGFSSALVATLTITEIEPVAGANQGQGCLQCCPNASCAVVTGRCGQAIIPSGGNGGTPGVQIKITGTTASSPTNVVLVGSSNETQNTPGMVQPSVTNTVKGNNWVSIPYHTTWVKANDICVTLGATAASSAITITRIDASSGAATNFGCGSSATLAANFSLVIGEAVRVIKTNTSFAPALPAGGMTVPHF